MECRNEGGDRNNKNVTQHKENINEAADNKTEDKETYSINISDVDPEIDSKINK